MTDPEFRNLVRMMRSIQKRFFRTRTADRPPDLIRQAEEFESLVDEVLDASDRTDRSGAASTQRTLFDDDDRRLS